MRPAPPLLRVAVDIAALFLRSALWMSLLIPLAHAQPSEALAERRPIRIVVAGPANGPNAKLSKTIAAGAREAADQLAKDGTQSFDVTVADDGCDAARAEVLAKEIVAGDADLVLGHPCPKAAIAAAKVYGAAGLPFIATETRHPDLTSKRAGSSIFRLSGRDDAQGTDAARYLAEGLAADSSVAIVHDRTLFAKTIAEQAEAELKRRKITLITGTIIGGDKEYRKLAEKIKGARRLFFAGFPLEAGFVMKSLRAAGSSAVLVATDTIATKEFTSSFQEIAKESYVLLPHANSPAPAAATAVRLYARASGLAHGPFHDAAARRAAIAASLQKLEGLGDAPGSVANMDPANTRRLDQLGFDATGNADLSSYGLWRWTGEAWEQAASIAATAPPSP